MTNVEELLALIAAGAIITPMICSIMYIIGKNKFEKEVLKHFLKTKNAELIFLTTKDAYDHFISIESGEKDKKLEVERLKRYVDEQASKQVAKLADEIKEQLSDIRGSLGNLEKLFLNHVIGGK